MHQSGVVSGRATGVVVAIGNETELGRINQLLAGVNALETPLLRQITKFGYTITAVIGFSPDLAGNTESIADRTLSELL